MGGWTQGMRLRRRAAVPVSDSKPRAFKGQRATQPAAGRCRAPAHTSAAQDTRRARVRHAGTRRGRNRCANRQAELATEARSGEAVAWPRTADASHSPTGMLRTFGVLWVAKSILSVTGFMSHSRVKEVQGADPFRVGVPVRIEQLHAPCAV
eukprot:353387-Chlamydomonas_euryale.AAC.2